MQTRNDYQLGVFNGEVGTVHRVDKQELVVKFDSDVYVTYNHEQARALQLAYASTVHKCVSPTTLVETPHGLQEIQHLEREGVIGTDVGGRYYTSLVHNPVSPMLRLTTKDGYALEVTPDHGVMVWRGDCYQRVCAKDVEKNDFVRLRLGVSVDATLAPELPVLTDAGFDARTQLYATPTVLNENVAEFIGLMVADGTLFARGFALAKRHMDVVQRFGELCTKIFGKPTQVQNHSGFYKVEVGSVYLATWLQAIGGLAAEHKSIPTCIMRAPISMQRAFLRGLFEDGGVNVRDDRLDHIEWTTEYERMAEIVHTMLLRCGVIAARIKRRNAWHIYIYGQNAVRFSEAVGFVASAKNDRLQKLAGAETRYLIPVARGRLTSRQDSNVTTRNTISRAKAIALGGFDDELLYHHDRIEKIEGVAGESWCVTVPDHGRFLQNGFDGSNCQGSEFENVVVVCHSSQSIMLTRQLFYTAITRAKKRVFLVGDKEGLRKALNTSRDELRKTRLAVRIQGGAA
jgi:hypothetical protein